jgi:hypothetical protein
MAGCGTIQRPERAGHREEGDDHVAAGRLGLAGADRGLTPHGDVGPEAEFRAMPPEGASIHAARVGLGVHAPGARGTMDRVIAHDVVRAFAKPPLVDDA